MANENIVLPVGWTPASTLVNSTGDAMDNIFDILIDWPGSSTGSNGVISTSTEAAVSYRATGFQIVEPKTKTYTVSWRGVSVEKVAAGVEMSRKFDLEFRLDANYALYQKFVAWHKLTTDVNTSGVANTSSALGRIQVVAPGAEYNAMSWSTPVSSTDSENLVSKALPNTTNLVWTFEDVSVVGVGTPKFSNGSSTGKAMQYKVSFTFGDVAYPFYTSANNVAHNHREV